MVYIMLLAKLEPHAQIKVHSSRIHVASTEADIYTAATRACLH